MLNSASRILIASLSIIFAQCTEGNQLNLADEKAEIPILIMADKNEPGVRLQINGQVVDCISSKGIEGAEIYFYHADSNGEYLPEDPNDESTAKLSGEIITGKEGKFILKTIMPREYDQPGNKHIHIHYARAEGYKQTGGVILFDSDVNDEIREWANETGFGTIINATNVGSNLVGELKIYLNLK